MQLLLLLTFRRVTNSEFCAFSQPPQRQVGHRASLGLIRMIKAWGRVEWESTFRVEE